MRNYENKECSLSVGTLTQAMRAQAALASAAVRAEVIKSDSRKSGCGYAILFDCIQEENVRLILKNAGIRVRR